jgi:uncharacterized protein (TIGR02246 family)
MRSSTVFLSAFVALAAALAFADDAPNIASDLAQKWMQTFDAQNATGIAAMFATDGVFFPAPTVMLKGRDAIEKALAARFKAGWDRENVSVSEAHSAGNVIWAYGDYTLIGSGQAQGKTVTGKFTEVLVRDGDTWHVAQLMGQAVPPK